MHNIGVRVGLNIDPVEGVRKEEDKYLSFANAFNVTDGSVIPFNALDKTFMENFVKNVIDVLLDLNIDVFWLDYKKDMLGLNALNYYFNKDIYFYCI